MAMWPRAPGRLCPRRLISRVHQRHRSSRAARSLPTDCLLFDFRRRPGQWCLFCAAAVGIGGSALSSSAAPEQ
eukprot:11108821-Karenia_brevis.AAC.1